MSITINIYYKGENGSARDFAREMIESGIVDEIKKEPGNIRYNYFFPIDDVETVLLIDTWENQEAIDIHHNSTMMEKIVKLREKYNLHMIVERYIYWMIISRIMTKNTLKNRNIKFYKTTVQKAGCFFRLKKITNIYKI